MNFVSLLNDHILLFLTHNSSL